MICLFWKKREKKRWIFRKPTTQETVVTQQTQVKPSTDNGAAADGATAAAEAEQRHAISVAVAKAAAAEAAVAMAQAAVQVARLTNKPTNYAREYHYAAIVIQTAFRGYLVRV